MKINTYKEYSELYKTASKAEVFDEGEQLLRRLFKSLDEVADISSEGFQQTIKNIAVSAKGIQDDTKDIYQFLEELVRELDATRIQQKIDSGEMLEELRRAQDAFAEADRKRQFHFNRFKAAQSKNQKLKEDVNKLKVNYEKALEQAAAESTDLKKTIDALNDEVAGLTNNAAKANAQLVEAANREAALVRGFEEQIRLLEQMGQRAVKAETALEALRKEYGELVAIYEKTLKDADEARAALKAAQQAGAPAPVVQSLKQVSESKTKAADEIATKITKGDPAAKQKIESEVRSKKTKPAEAPSAAPEADSKLQTQYDQLKEKYDRLKRKSKRSDVPDSIPEALGQGLRTWVKDFAAKSLVGGGFKLLGFAALGLSAWYGGPMLWDWWFSRNEEVARQLIETFEGYLKDAHAKLSKVTFKAGTSSQQVQQNLLLIFQSHMGLTAQMAERHQDQEFVQQASLRLNNLIQEAENFVNQKDFYATELENSNGWNEAISSIFNLVQAGKELLNQIETHLAQATQQAATQKDEDFQATREMVDNSPMVGGLQRKAPDPNDKGINVLGTKVYLSQYTELDPGTRSAAPYLIKRVLLTPTGLAFWDPENKWGGGFLKNHGTIGDQVIRHIKFFMNPSSIDSDWAYGPINNEAKLKKFMRKNLPKSGRKPSSGYKSTRKEYRRNRPRLASSNNINYKDMDLAMKNREKRLNILEKIANSTNRTAISTENIEKYADSVSKQFYQDALRGLDDQYAKSYYTGLKSMYDQKLGGDKADYKSLYEPNGGTGTEILEASHPKSVVLSDAKGNGGLVENVIEQQRHNIGVALSTPTGNFRGKHANLVDALKKIATAADEESENSKIVNEAIKDIVSILKANGTYK